MYFLEYYIKYLYSWLIVKDKVLKNVAKTGSYFSETRIWLLNSDLNLYNSNMGFCHKCFILLDSHHNYVLSWISGSHKSLCSIIYLKSLILDIMSPVQYCMKNLKAKSLSHLELIIVPQNGGDVSFIQNYWLGILIWIWSNGMLWHWLILQHLIVLSTFVNLMYIMQKCLEN